MQRSNNLKNPDNDKHIYYKLWVTFLPGTKQYSFFSEHKFNYKGLPKYGKQKQLDQLVKNCFEKQEKDIKTAILYDYQTNEKIADLK